jgi:hypothetical protein
MFAPTGYCEAKAANSFMMKKISIILFCFSALLIQSQSPEFRWSKSISGSQFEQARSIAVDHSGNIYATGSFNGSADFDPGPATTTLSSPAPRFDDIFVTKLDSSGKLIWVKQFGDLNADIGFGIATDQNSNVFITGYFQGTVDFDPSPATFKLSSVGQEDIFVLKLNSAGDFIWAKSFGSPTSDFGEAIAVDNEGSAYITGFFSGTVDFDPGDGSKNLTAQAFKDIFVLKLDASGNLSWVNARGGSSDDIGYSIAVDDAGNVYTTGSFRSTVDFNAGDGVSNLTATASQDIFVLKLNKGGAYEWAIRIGGDATCNARCIRAPGNGNILLTGYFNGTADFNPGDEEFKMTSAGAADIFILQLDGSGNMVWATKLGGPLDDYGNSIAVDRFNNFYITGNFAGSVDFDPGPSAVSLTSAGKDDIFVCKFDFQKNLSWARRLGGAKTEEVRAITIDAQSNLYITGTFQGMADMDPTDGMMNLNATGMDDIFILKLAQPGNKGN